MNIRAALSSIALLLIAANSASAQARVPAGYWERVGLMTGGDYTAGERGVTLKLNDGFTIGPVKVVSIEQNYIAVRAVNQTNAPISKIYRMKLSPETNRQYSWSVEQMLRKQRAAEAAEARKLQARLDR